MDVYGQREPFARHRNVFVGKRPHGSWMGCSISSDRGSWDMRRLRVDSWFTQVAVIAAYAAAYILLRPISDAHFPIIAGLRLGCLLLMPYRLWPALVVGELLPLAYFNILWTAQFGTPALLLETTPPIAIAMPIVWWCRSRLALFPNKRLINVKTLLICGLLVSLVWTLVNFGTIAAIRPSAENPPMPVDSLMLVGLFIGKYIAILAVVPWVLMAKTDYGTGLLRSRLQRFAKSRLLIETASLILPAFVALSWLSLHGSEDARQLTRMVMFLPALWLTIRYGWRAAVISGTLAIICICSVIESRPEPDILQAQGFIAFAVTCLFAIGARITAQNLREVRGRLDAKSAMELAQRSLYQGELRIRQMATALEELRSASQISHARLLDRVKHLLQSSESQNFHSQAAEASSQAYRLADSMHPAAWRDRGLSAALQETIALTLDETGMAYSCKIKGRGLHRLAPYVQAALYRLACETVVYICGEETCLSIALSLRTGETNGEGWAVLRLEGTLQGIEMSDTSYRKLECQYLATRFGAVGLDLASMRDHVRLYGGELHVKTIHDKLRITFLLQDVKKNERERSTAPAQTQLWVN
jgi:glucose-6-phosphate-specific signal transduction histidine kinase